MFNEDVNKIKIQFLKDLVRLLEIGALKSLDKIERIDDVVKLEAVWDLSKLAQNTVS